jgi:hypothetical protein
MYLEFFSVVDYHQLERYMEKSSHDVQQAKRILDKSVPAAAKRESGDWEVQIPLFCPGHIEPSGPMQTPVYGKSCKHIEVP